MNGVRKGKNGVENEVGGVCEQTKKNCFGGSNSANNLSVPCSRIADEGLMKNC